ncbi:ribosome silencing factor [Limibacter armeniacum]|uniref:ribosome silencing factor n=1 Tax=Limibacter armeniacum TaxID=466084 RepID=UPI002FE65B98
MEDRKKGISSEELAGLIVNGMKDKKAQDIVVLDLRKVQNAMTDFFVICSGTSDRQVDAIKDGIEESTWKFAKEDPYRKEGLERSEWVLLDYINVVAHVFTQKKRAFFGLEDLWGDAIVSRVD